MREWKLLFTINHDGVSYQTFYNNLRSRDNTVILINDHKGSVFGAYCTEEWRIKSHFYGTGESFVFKFDDDDDIKVFGYTQLNDKVQFSDENCLMIGGGTE
jgi:hypothetical protein